LSTLHVEKPEWIGIVVAGEPGSNKSKVYCSKYTLGPPVSRRVQLPERWDALLTERTTHKEHT